MIPLKLVLIYVRHIKETNEKVKKNRPVGATLVDIGSKACQPINEKCFRYIYQHWMFIIIGLKANH